MKVWHSICLLFFFYSVSTLVGERYEVRYKSENRTEPYRYSFCLAFEEIEIFANKSELRLAGLRNELYDYFKKRKQFTFVNLARMYNESLLFPLSSGNFFLMNHHLCLIGSHESTKFLASTAQLKFYRQRYYVVKDDFELFEPPRLHTVLNQLVVLKKKRPYSDCSGINSRFLCLNECFKKRANLSRYFYKSDEDSNISLIYDPDDPAMLSHEVSCFGRCKYESCKLTYFSDSRNSLALHSSVFEAYPLTTEFDFWLSLVGLILLMTKISLYQAVSRMLKRLIGKLKLDSRSAKCRKITQRTIVAVKYFVLLASVTYCLVSFWLMIDDYQRRVNQPEISESTTQLLEPDKLTVVFCLNALDFIFRDSEESRPRLIVPIMNYYENRSFFELERDTNDSYKILKEVYMKFQTKFTKVHWTIDRSKVIFKGRLAQVLRCHQVTIFPMEPKYSGLLTVSMLVMEFDNPKKFQLIYNLVQIYLLVGGERLSTESYHYVNLKGFTKIIVRSSRLNGKCVNYAELGLGCNNRKDCVLRCAYQQFTGNLSVIPFNDVVIDKDDYDDLQWRTLPLISNAYDLQNFREACAKRFPLRDCKFERFLNSYTLKSSEDSRRFVNLNPYIDVLRRVEEEPSKYKLVLDMLNILSILFGCTVFQLLVTGFGWLRISVINNRTCRWVCYAVCLTGFTIHYYFVFREVLTGELIHSQHYEEPEQVEMCDILICFNIETSSIDPNHRLTGSYLRSTTQDIRINQAFTSIDYLGESNSWISLKRNYSNEDLSMSTFYLADKKCFEIKLEKNYRRDQFHFLADKKVLKIHLNESFVGKKRLHFFTKKRGTVQFNKIFTLPSINKPQLFRAESFLIKQEDKFSLLKHPLSLFYGESSLKDVNLYIRNLMSGFERRFGLATLLLPLNRKSYDHPIDDELFSQYYAQVQNVSDHSSPSNENYLREFTIDFHEQAWDERELYISYEFIWFRKVILITNDQNYATLILSLLNVLSLWLNFCILDSHIYLFQLAKLFSAVYRLLRALRERLWRIAVTARLNQPLDHRRLEVGHRGVKRPKAAGSLACKALSMKKKRVQIRFGKLRGYKRRKVVNGDSQSAENSTVENSLPTEAASHLE